MDPQESIRLLERLTGHGFDDSVYREVHRFPDDRMQTIERHLEHCRRVAAGTGEFRYQADHPEGTNARVQRRLAIILGEYEGGGFARPGPRALLNVRIVGSY
jgi:hypothetical protein